MYRLTALAPLLLIAACAAPLPKSNPNMAWIDLYTSAGNNLIAQNLDGRTWANGRYFEVTPGAHELEVNFSFDLTEGGGQRMDDGRRTCALALDYSDFKAGQRYQLQAEKMGFRPWIRLYDDQHHVVARGKVQRCPAY